MTAWQVFRPGPLCDQGEHHDRQGFIMNVLNRTDSVLQPVLGLLLGIGAGLFIWFYDARFGIGYREILFLFFLLVAVLFIIRIEKVLEIGVVAIVVSLIFGYRTFDVYQRINVHPAEFLIWAVFFLHLIRILLVKQERRRIQLPALISIWVVIWAWTGINTYFRGNTADLAIMEAKNYIILLPVFWLMACYLDDRRKWEILAKWFFISGVIIGTLGVLEFLFPSIGSVSGGFISGNTKFMSQQHFMRGNFSFFGAPTAVFINIISLPFAFILWKTGHRRIFIIIGIVIQIFSIYISGYRSIWLILSLQAILFAMFSRNPYWIFLVLIISVVIYLHLPESAIERFESSFSFGSDMADHSLQSRQGRVMAGFYQMIKFPFGSGWGGLVYLHSDFSQIASNQGLPGLLIVILIVFSRFFKLTRELTRKLSEDSDGIATALFLCFLALIIQFAANGVMQLQQLAIPYLLILAMTEVFFMGQQKTGFEAEDDKNLSASARI